jgi:S-adenosylmethionine:tRNA ribosyltransferase-isomerase
VDASELDYDLPEELIAQAPLAERSGARLMCVQRNAAEIQHRAVLDLPSLLPPALFVLNDTKVIPARLYLYKPTGGRVEFLLVERLAAAAKPATAAPLAPQPSAAAPLTPQPSAAAEKSLRRSSPELGERWLALGKTHKGIREGMLLASENNWLHAKVVELRGGGDVVLELSTADADVASALDQVGRVPLPPYIRRAPDAADLTRYQTVFAKEAGAVAAPTAGLHLSEQLLAQLIAAGHELAYVTLHVGPGTFAPLRAADLREHAMHSEQFVIPEQTAAAIIRAKAARRPVVAVGTTVVRTLEANAADGGVRAGAGRTAIFIYPPYQFRVIDALLTNFHLPRSTLLALVMAFAGEATARAAYAEAIAQHYRFFSYGDAMLIRGEQ